MVLETNFPSASPFSHKSGLVAIFTFPTHR